MEPFVLLWPPEVQHQTTLGVLSSKFPERTAKKSKNNVQMKTIISLEGEN